MKINWCSLFLSNTTFPGLKIPLFIICRRCRWNYINFHLKSIFTFSFWNAIKLYSLEGVKLWVLLCFLVVPTWCLLHYMFPQASFNLFGWLWNFIDHKLIYFLFYGYVFWNLKMKWVNVFSHSSNYLYSFPFEQGRITAYLPSGGPFVRMDSHVYPDYVVPPSYDSLLGKVFLFRSCSWSCDKLYPWAIHVIMC